MVRSSLWVKLFVVLGVVCGSVGLSEASAAGRSTLHRPAQSRSSGSGGGGSQQQAINQVRSHAVQLAAQEHARFVAKRRAAAIAKGNLPGGTTTTDKAK